VTTPAAPLLVRLDRQRVVGVGGGAVAAGKLGPLISDHGAAVEVVAPRLDERLEGRVRWHRREYAGPSDLAGALLVLAATDRADVNARVAADAAEQATLCVRSDAQADATAAFPAVVRQGPLTIAVGTDGRSPTVARWLRRELQATYGPEYGQLVALLGELRADPTVTAALDRLPDEGRRAAWRSIPLVDILKLLRTGSVESAKEVAAECLSSFSD
jgi:precorrin-2 dehydrogenase / sirohydrochlorin ferrochelatase